MIIPQEQIRPAIREMATVEELQGLINICFDEDSDFVRECASEIYYRNRKAQKIEKI